MILTAHQPVYLPWLGLLHKIALAERYCVFDIAQYQKKDYNNRNLIKSPQGPHWLSVPVESKNHFEKRLCDVRIVNDGWNRKHWRSIQLAYQKAAHFGDYADGVERLLLGRTYEHLAHLNFECLTFMLAAFGISVPIVRASDHAFTGAKSDLVLDMCVQLGATHYVFGAQGRNYANVESFRERGIQVYFQDYHHPTYAQQHGSFAPCMTALDLLFNEGPRSREVLFEGNARHIAELAPG